MAKAHSKSTSPHKTTIEVAECFLEHVANKPEVTKVSLGIIKFIKGARAGIPKRIKCTSEPACLLLKVRGNLYTQEIRFYTSSTEKLQKEIEDFAREEGFMIT
jgi:hypothetical protein